jgi:hypothetical protein
MAERFLRTGLAILLVNAGGYLLNFVYIALYINDKCL